MNGFGGTFAFILAGMAAILANVAFPLWERRATAGPVFLWGCPEPRRTLFFETLEWLLALTIVVMLLAATALAVLHGARKDWVNCFGYASFPAYTLLVVQESHSWIRIALSGPGGDARL